MTEHTADLRREEIARIERTLFDAMGWTTRKADTAGTYGLVHPLPTGLVTGDPDNPEWTTLATRLHDLGLRSQDTATARIAAPFDAKRMTHAWSILEAHTNPDRWEPDRYNAAAFVRALLDKYEWLATATLADLAPKYVAARAVLSGETRTGGEPT